MGLFGVDLLARWFWLRFQSTRLAIGMADLERKDVSFSDRRASPPPRRCPILGNRWRWQQSPKPSEYGDSQKP